MVKNLLNEWVLVGNFSFGFVISLLFVFRCFLSEKGEILTTIPRHLCSVVTKLRSVVPFFLPIRHTSCDVVPLVVTSWMVYSMLSRTCTPHLVCQRCRLITLDNRFSERVFSRKHKDAHSDDHSCLLNVSRILLFCQQKKFAGIFNRTFSSASVQKKMPQFFCHLNCMLSQHDFPSVCFVWARNNRRDFKVVGAWNTMSAFYFLTSKSWIIIIFL